MTEFNEQWHSPQTTLEHVGFVDDIEGVRHELITGYDGQWAQELVDLTESDEGAQRWTDDADRFASVEAIERWRHEKDRSMYWLVNVESRLKGVIFFGPKQPETPATIPGSFDEPHTMGIRVYGDDTRGKGLGHGLLKLGHSDYLRRRAEQGKSVPDVFWLSTAKGNPAHRLYRRFGYDKYIRYINGAQVMFGQVDKLDIHS